MKNGELRESLYKNLLITLLVQLVRMFLQFVLQKIFIDTLGIEYLGYNSVFKNILQMLNMADLGVGVAITGFLFKPLAMKDHERVSALMYIYKRVYHLIGFTVTGVGIVIMVLLPAIIPDSQCSDAYLRLLFAINFAGTISTYFLAYRRTLLIADQKSYYTNTIDMVIDLLGTLLQIIMLFIIPNYIIYLVINVGKNILSNIIIAVESSKNFSEYLKKPQIELVKEYKNPIRKYVGDVFVSKIGAYVFNGTDNIIISICKGSLLAGYLSNYTVVSIGIKGIITQVLSAVQATYGKYIVTETDKSKQCIMTDNYIYIDYLIGNVCMICCIMLFQPFVRIYYGTHFLLAFSTAILIAINLGLAILLIIPSQIFVVFKLYKYDKFVICFSAVLNIVISVSLVMYMGVNGVLIGTTITSLIYLISRLYIIATKVFDIKFGHYAVKLLEYAALSVVSLGISMLAGKNMEINTWGKFTVYAIMMAGISFVIPVVCTSKMKESIFFIKNIFPFGRNIFWGLIVVASVVTMGIFTVLSRYFS